MEEHLRDSKWWTLVKEVDLLEAYAFAQGRGAEGNVSCVDPTEYQEKKQEVNVQVGQSRTRRALVS